MFLHYHTALDHSPTCILDHIPIFPESHIPIFPFTFTPILTQKCQKLFIQAAASPYRYLTRSPNNYPRFISEEQSHLYQRAQEHNIQFLYILHILAKCFIPEGTHFSSIKHESCSSPKMTLNYGFECTC